MSAVRDMGRIMQHRLDVLHRPDPAPYSPMRTCADCRKRRSITQFTGASTACNRCARRQPQEATS